MSLHIKISKHTLYTIFSPYAVPNEALDLEVLIVKAMGHDNEPA